MSGSFSANRLTITIGGTRVATPVEMTVTRDLAEITGRFELRYLDGGRAAAAMPATAPTPIPSPLLRRQPATIALDGETVLAGWLFELRGAWQAHRIEAFVGGRDKSCDLADCSVAPTGPAEWKNANLLQVAQQICQPFGMKAVAQTAVGAAFPRLALGAHESGLSVLEKAARQRGVLVVSDGVGGLLLTTAGKTTAPADLRLGGNVLRAAYRYDERRRYSDIYVKGQSEKGAGTRPAEGPAFSHATAPATQALPSWAVGVERAGALISGHATDPEVTRWRPSVRMARTQSGSANAQQQAEWAVRVERGLSVELVYTVLDWRANGELWRPNTLVRVSDPYTGIDDIMLIKRVSYRLGPDGENAVTPTTDVTVVGRTAFDRINQPMAKRPLKGV